jgi:hypothetical protein
VCGEGHGTITAASKCHLLQGKSDCHYTRFVLPRTLRPMRLSRRAEPFDSDQFIYELKIDGFTRH